MRARDVFSWNTSVWFFGPPPQRFAKIKSWYQVACQIFADESLSVLKIPAHHVPAPLFPAGTPSFNAFPCLVLPSCLRPTLVLPHADGLRGFLLPGPTWIYTRLSFTGKGGGKAKAERSMEVVSPALKTGAGLGGAWQFPLVS